MFDKLSIINTALSRSGNNLVAFEGDGTPEWIVASDAYETELPLLIADHDWGFATATDELARTGDSEDARFEDAYAKPSGCLHLIAIYEDGYPVPYDILRNKIVLTSRGSGNPVAKYVVTPSNDQWPPHFLEALRWRVMSHVYRGLNEDQGAADKAYQASVALLQDAKSRTDQESPPKALFMSRIGRARRIRRGDGMTANTLLGSVTSPVK